MTRESELTAVCYVRAPLLLEPVDRQVETLRACESEGSVDTMLLRSWPDKVTVSQGSSDREVLRVVDRFEEWADERGVTVRPPFKRRTVSSPVTDETKEVLVTPLICLALYHDERLIGVFPHSAGDETYTTTEAIAELRTDEIPTPLGESTVGEVAGSNRCPDCDGFLVDGQGLFTCLDCEWVGVLTGDGRLAPADRDDASRPLSRPLSNRIER